MSSFSIDELDKIVDVTMGSVESVHRAAELGQQKSPLKGNLSQVGGVILKSLKDNVIVIRTESRRRALLRGSYAHSAAAGDLIQRPCGGALGGRRKQSDGRRVSA